LMLAKGSLCFRWGESLISTGDFVKQPLMICYRTPTSPENRSFSPTNELGSVFFVMRCAWHSLTAVFIQWNCAGLEQWRAPIIRATSGLTRLPGNSKKRKEHWITPRHSKYNDICKVARRSIALLAVFHRLYCTKWCIYARNGTGKESQSNN
jgi:hypothetical protein